jgi:hypothetical protein
VQQTGPIGNQACSPTPPSLRLITSPLRLSRCSSRRPPLLLPVTASTRDCARRREIQAAIDPLPSKLPALISIHPPYVSSSLPRPTSSTEVTYRYSARPPCYSAASLDDTNRRPKRKEKRRALTRKPIRPRLLLRLWHPDPDGGRGHTGI